jgi:enterochelin esterase-like enzyme
MGLRSRRRRAYLVLGTCATVAAVAAIVAEVGTGQPTSSSPAAREAPARVRDVACPSPSLNGTLPSLVYLPAGYASAGLRYPVIYFLHGLPAGPDSYKQNAFVAQAIANIGRRALVVAVQGARTDNDDREYLDWGPKENWAAAIASDLPRCIDARFHTIPYADARALIGLSAGGFGAFNIGLRHLSTFSAVESWSGYFYATDPTGLRRLDLGSKAANRKARVPRGRRLLAQVTTRPAFVGFYVGRQDTRFLQANIELNQAFTARRIPHLFRIYPGGHSDALWTDEAPQWLALALATLATPQRR